MSPAPRDRGRRAALTSRAARVTVASVAGLLVASALGTGWSTSASADPVYPSAGEVARAQGAVRSAGASVAALQARLAVSSARLDDLQTQVQVAVEAYDVAQYELEQRSKAAVAAHEQADAAAGRASKAQDDVGQLAVDSYVKGHGLGGLEVLVGTSSPNDLLERAAGVQIASSITHQTLDRAEASKVVAQLMRRQTDLALARQEAAAAKVEQAHRAVEAQAANAQAETDRIQASRAQMIVQLAGLRKTSVALETQRQAGVEEQARLRAEQAREEASRKAAAVARAVQAAQDRRDRALQAAQDRRDRALQAAQDRRDRAATQTQRAQAKAAVQAEVSAPAKKADAPVEATVSQRRNSSHSSSSDSSSSSGSSSDNTSSDNSSSARSDSSSSGSSSDSTSSARSSGGASGSSTSGSSSDSSSSGSSSSGRRAVDWARSQVGKDYEWAADGPSTYDCSGLTLRAWEQSGVYLPHSSRLQYQLAEHVPYDEIRPGDLIFYATNPGDPGTIHHVGIYLGGGQVVEAPYTGAQVRVRSVYRSGMMPYAGRP